MKVELLESRRMLSVSLVGKTLRVTGTEGDDVIFFGEEGVYTTGNSSGNGLFVEVNGRRHQFGFHEVKRIVVTTDGGNDDVYVPRLFTTGAFHPLGRPGFRTESHVSIPAMIDGGAGNDTIIGGGANDTLRGGQDHDHLDGQTGDDQLFGDAGKDTMVGGLGADTFSGGKHTDTADYSARRDDLHIVMLTDNPGVEQFDMGDTTGKGGTAEGDQVLRDTENVISGSGDDVISGSYSANLIDGGAGNDTLSGAEGGDTVFGGPGDDVIQSYDFYGPRHTDADGRPIGFGHWITYGNDVIDAGIGRDSVDADMFDTVTRAEDLDVAES